MNPTTMDVSISRENQTRTPETTLAGRIQQLRRQRGISQEELAGAVKVSRQAVSKWESAQAQPELEKLLVLSDFFQVSTDYLLKGEPTAPEPPSITTSSSPSAQGRGRQLFIINATLFNYIGLLLGWGLWDYWQLSICAMLSVAMTIIGAAVLAVGLNTAPEAQERRRLWRSFWCWNIWPIAQLALGLLYSALSTGGQILAPVISHYYFAWAGIGLFVFFWGAWLIICLSVWRNCRSKLNQ
jgi:transcriptional regulator with XRE-family HTH domain